MTEKKESEKPTDELTTRLKRRRSSSIRKLSVISLSGISSAWRKNSFFGSKYQLGAEAPVEEVRQRVLSLIGDGSAYDARDVNKVHHNKWFIQRFVLDRLHNTYSDQEDQIEDAASAIACIPRWRSLRLRSDPPDRYTCCADRSSTNFWLSCFHADH